MKTLLNDNRITYLSKQSSNLKVGKTVSCLKTYSHDVMYLLSDSASQLTTKISVLNPIFIPIPFYFSKQKILIAHEIANIVGSVNSPQGVGIVAIVVVLTVTSVNKP